MLQVLTIGTFRKQMRNPGEFERSNVSRRIAFCSACNAFVQIVTRHDADNMLLANWNRMIRLFEEGQIHEIPGPDEEVQYCANSMRIREPRAYRKQTITLQPLTEMIKTASK